MHGCLQHNPAFSCGLRAKKSVKTRANRCWRRVAHGDACCADAKHHLPIHREAPPFVEQSTEQEILVTGIKVCDCFLLTGTLLLAHCDPVALLLVRRHTQCAFPIRAILCSNAVS